MKLDALNWVWKCIFISNIYVYYNWKLITTLSVPSHNLEYHLVFKHTPILQNAIESSNILIRKILIYSCRTNGTCSAKITMVEKPFNWKIHSVKMKRNTFSSNFFWAPLKTIQLWGPFSLKPQFKVLLYQKKPAPIRVKRNETEKTWSIIKQAAFLIGSWE